jgi:ribosomal protein S19E (S16A)
MLVYVLLLVEDGLFDLVSAQKSFKQRERMHAALDELKEQGYVNSDEKEGWVVTQNGQIKVAEIRSMIS